MEVQLNIKYTKYTKDEEDVLMPFLFDLENHKIN